MSVEAVLERLGQMGVEVEIDGVEVYVNPSDRVPYDMWPELSRTKLDIFIALMSERIIASSAASMFSCIDSATGTAG